jgi:hypothetical protein
MNIKTFEEYMKQKKFVLPVCEDKKYDGIIYLQDNSKINYTCELGATNEFIGEVITTPKYPFVEFYKRYYSDTKSLAVIYSKIGEMSIDKYYHYDQNYKLVKEIDYKQKRYRMKKLGLSIVVLLLLGCATHNGIKQNNIKKEIYMNIKTFEEYMKQKKFVLPDCNTEDDYGNSSVIYLTDKTKIEYSCALRKESTFFWETILHQNILLWSFKRLIIVMQKH